MLSKLFCLHALDHACRTFAQSHLAVLSASGLLDAPWPAAVSTAGMAVVLSGAYLGSDQQRRRVRHTIPDQDIVRQQVAGPAPRSYPEWGAFVVSEPLRHVLVVVRLPTSLRSRREGATALTPAAPSRS